MTIHRDHLSIFGRCSPRAFGRLALTLTGALALVACATPPVNLERGTQRLESHLERLEQRGFAGQVAVVRGDEILINRGFGYMAVDDPRPITSQSVMPLASLTKAFTASAVLALAAEGRLGLDEPIGNHLPGLARHWAEIPIRHYLTHTAGLPAEIINRAWRDSPPRFEPVGRETFVKRLDQFKPDHPPGQGYNYSNVGYSLLAVLIEHLAEQSYESYLRGTLLATSGIEGIGFALQGWSEDDLVSGRRGQQSVGHYFDQPQIEGGLGWKLRGAGDLLAQPAAIIAWWQAIRDQRWLSSPWLDVWLTPQQEKPDGSQYGYGLIFRDSSHGPVIGHPGGDFTFAVDFSWYQDLDLMIYIATADARFEADVLRDELHRLLLGRL
jgi:CubicO group peptidase (beta-lactamase class C family)